MFTLDYFLFLQTTCKCNCYSFQLGCIPYSSFPIWKTPTHSLGSNSNIVFNVLFLLPDPTAETFFSSNIVPNVCVCVCVCVCVWVTQLCLTLWDPLNSSLPGSSIHGILQSRTLEWVAFPFIRGSFQPRDETQVSSIADSLFTIWATSVAYSSHYDLSNRTMSFCDHVFTSFPTKLRCIWVFLSSVQFSHSVMSDSLQPHGLQHAGLPCPSRTPRACRNLCPSSYQKSFCHSVLSSPSGGSKGLFSIPHLTPTLPIYILFPRAQLGDCMLCPRNKRVSAMSAS